MKYVIEVDTASQVLDKDGVGTGVYLMTDRAYKEYQENEISDPKTVLALVESGIDAKMLISLKDSGVI